MCSAGTTTSLLSRLGSLLPPRTYHFVPDFTLLDSSPVLQTLSCASCSSDFPTTTPLLRSRTLWTRHRHFQWGHCLPSARPATSRSVRKHTSICSSTTCLAPMSFSTYQACQSADGPFYLSRATPERYGPCSARPSVTQKRACTNNLIGWKFTGMLFSKPHSPGSPKGVKYCPTFGHSDEVLGVELDRQHSIATSKPKAVIVAFSFSCLQHYI